MSSPTPSPDEAGPRTALTEMDWPTLANIIRAADGNHILGAGDLADAILTALSERGYTIVASDRLAGLDVERLANAIARTRWPSFVSIHHPDAADPREDWVAEHWGLWATDVARAIVAGDALSRSGELAP